MTGATDQDPPPELAASRTRFIAELGERLTTLRQGLARLGGAAESAAELNALRRRVHALAAAADVLRFTSAAEALAHAEAGLAGAGGWDPGPAVRERVGRILDLLPSLVLGAPIDLAAALDGAGLPPWREPLCVVVYGDASLESLLHTPGAAHSCESHATRQPEQAIELAAQLSPDVLLVDGDDPNASEILPRLRQASGARPAAVVAVGSFEHPEPLLRLIRRGVARVLPKPTDAGTLQRTLRSVTLSESTALPSSRDFHRLSADDLVDLIAEEARRAFRDPAAARPGPSLDFGSGAELQAALWSAFARVRALGARAAEGAAVFPREGPAGTLLLAPDRPGSARGSLAPVPLAGRRLVVADDDDAIRALLCSALSELGAVVLPARGGAEALELAERHWPDALISDTCMPGLDGFELCRRIRADVALSDLPILLVAWKEYLLECTRRPARPSASALELLDGPALAAALRECLATRAALEQRLAQHDTVHGRLDGLTPRLLLQMVCSRSPNALLSLRCGALGFEFSISDGKPVHARWYEGEQQRAEGRRVLAPFLGVRTGRFSVEPLFSPPKAHFEGDAMAVLQPAALRARRAREQLRPSHRGAVEQLVLDPLAAEHYLAEAPAQRPLLSQLGAPGALRSLAAGDGAGTDPARLDTLLEQLARRGAITALLDRDGRDLLPSFGSDEAPASSALANARAVPAEAAPVALELGEAVLQAVSDPQPSRPEALAPAAETRPASVPALPKRAANEPAAEATEAAAPAPATPAEAAVSTEQREGHGAASASAAPNSAVEAAPPAPVADAAASPEQSATAGGDSPAAAATANGEHDPRPGEHDTGDDESRQSWFDAPAPQDDGAPAPQDDDAVSAPLASDEIDGDEPPPHGARVRGLLARLSVSLGAALVAFLAIRLFATRAWDSLRGSSPPSNTAPALALAPPPVLPAEPARDAGPARSRVLYASAPSPSGGADPRLLTELLELPAGTPVPQGHGLLEVQSWKRQQIYVDGVFMGNYEKRLVPLRPGTYQVRLNDGARALEHSVEVQPGRRTRFSAQPKSTPAP